MQIKRKLTLAFLVLSLVSLAVAGGLAYAMARGALLGHVLLHLQSVAMIQKARIAEVLDRDGEGLALMTSRTQLRESMGRLVAGGLEEDRRNLQRVISDALYAVPRFRSIAVLDPRGVAVASTRPEEVGRDLSAAEAFRRGSTGPATNLFFLDASGGLANRLAAPLYDQNRLVGVLVIEAGAGKIEEIAAETAGLGNTGETMIVRREPDGAALFLAPLRFDPKAALTRRVEAGEAEHPVIQALMQKETLIGRGIDYRGQEVLAATAYLPGQDLGLTVKMDRSEALRPISAVRDVLLVFILVTAAVVLGVSLALARSISRPIVELTRTAGHVAAGDYSRRAEVETRDEMRVLAMAFNVMTERLVGDIAARRRAEEDLRVRSAELKGIIENSTSAIFLKDLGLRYVLVNRMFAEICGREPQEIIGRTADEIFPPDIADEASEHDREVLDKGASLRHERSYPVDGEIRHYIATKFPLLDPEGRPSAICGIYTDITDIKRAGVLREEVERMVRHDLKGPLSGIIGLPRLLARDENLTEHQREVLAVIEGAALRMQGIMNLSMDLYQMETGTFSPDPRPVDLLGLVRAAAEELAWLSRDKEAPVNVEIGGARVLAAGDPLHYSTIFSNLLANALEATPPGEPVRVEVRAETAARQAVCTLCNAGAVPEEIRESFFQKYVTAGKKGGTGMGTYNARLIALAYGGSAEFVTSGAGTCVTVRLPLHHLE